MPIEFILPDVLQNLHGRNVTVKSPCGRFVVAGQFRVQPPPNPCSVEIPSANDRCENYAVVSFLQEEVKSLTIEPDGDVTINLLVNE